MFGTIRQTMRQAATITALLALAGCGSGFFPPLAPPNPGPTPGTSADFVYVANQTTNTVAGLVVKTSTAGVASLTPVTGSPYAVSASPAAMAITPSNSFLYVGVTAGIYVYAINATTGALTIANTGGAVAVNSLGIVSIDISPDGQWLFALAGDGATINEYQINATTGALSATTGAQYTVVDGSTILPRMIKVAPNAAYVFVALGTGGDLVFPFTTSSGALSGTYQRLSTGNTKTSDNALAVDSGSTFLYIARSGASTGLAVFAIGTNGALNSVAGSPFVAGGGPYAVQIDSTGKYVYTANRTDSSISGFTIGTGGILTGLGGSPYVSGAGVTSLVRDSSAKYLLAAASGGTPDLTMYSFDATTPGKLNSATTAASGTDPAGSIMVVATH